MIYHLWPLWPLYLDIQSRLSYIQSNLKQGLKISYSPQQSQFHVDTQYIKKKNGNPYRSQWDPSLG